jgi:hypothetical protein
VSHPLHLPGHGAGVRTGQSVGAAHCTAVQLSKQAGDPSCSVSARRSAVLRSIWGDALTAVCALASTPIAVSRPLPEGLQRSVGVARRDVSTLLAEGLQAVRLSTAAQAEHRDLPMTRVTG